MTTEALMTTKASTIKEEMTLDEAVVLVIEECDKERAVFLAVNTGEVASEGGVEALSEHVENIRKEIRYWRHPRAKEVRETFKKYLKEKSSTTS